MVDDLSTGRRENLTTALEHGAELVEGDVTDPATVSELVESRRPERDLPPRRPDRRPASRSRIPSSTSDVNVGGTLNLLEAARRAEVGRFVLASTGGAIYGEGSDARPPARRDGRVPPGRALRADQVRRGGLPLALRAPLRALHSGPSPRQRLRAAAGPARRGGRRRDLLRRPAGAAARPGCSATAIRPGTTSTSPTSSRRCSRPATRASVGTFNIGTGVETSVLELGGMIADACDRPFEPEMAPPRPGEVQRIAIDSSLATDELGWTAGTALPDGLVQTAASFRGD